MKLIIKKNSLKELRNYNRYFFVRHKNRRKHNQHFKLLFFKINLYYGTSDYIPTYGKLSLFPINSIFWPSLLEKCKEDWCRPKYTTSFHYSVSKEVFYKPLKVAAAKKAFPSVFIINTTWLDECFSFHAITANSIFYTNLSVPRGLVQTSCCCVLSNKFWKKSVFYIHYLHSNITIMLIACKGSKRSSK